MLGGPALKPGGYMEDRADGQERNVQIPCHCHDQSGHHYQLEAIKARLVRAGANIVRTDPITIVADEPPDPPKNAA